MTKKKAIILGGITAWPLIYIPIFMLFALSMVANMSMQALSVTAHFEMFSDFLLLMVLHFLTILTVFGLMIFYMVYLFQTEVVQGDQKVLWAILLMISNIIVMPVFWYLFIWKNVSDQEPMEQADYHGVDAM